MIKRLVSFALYQPLFLLLVVALFIGAGVFAFRALPIEAFPDIGDIQVNVITLYPGRAAEEVEKRVTASLEVALSGLPHSVRMFSHTQFGLSFIMLTFDDQVTDYFARQQALERLQGVDLPAGSRRNSHRCRRRSARSTATGSKATVIPRANCGRWRTGWWNAS